MLPSDFPIDLRPYRVLAERLHMEEAELVAELRALRREGVIRRISAILNHSRFYPFNVMVVLRVEENRIEEVGQKIASFPEVTHLYEREKGDSWQYNLYAMIHARTKEDFDTVLDRILKEEGIKGYDLLPTKREFKKTGFSIS